MAASSNGVAVVGGSVAGLRALAELRAAGFAGTITLIDREAAAPYDRPPLSKQVLLGAWPPAKASLGDPRTEWGAEIVEQHAIALDTDSREIVLESDERVAYDSLIIATGATPRTIGDCRLEGVHVLRTMADCLAIRESLDRGGPLVVVGGGFIGAEVASAARASGVDVTLVEALHAPMARALGNEMGGRLRSLHEGNGTRVICGVAVDGFAGDTRVTGVHLDTGETLAADSVVVGVGVVPNTAWLENSKLTVDNGILCDQYCAAEGADDVFAIGDVARWYDSRRDRHVRVEHWTNATEQANTAAHNIINPGSRRAHHALPYFWSDQYGAKIQLIGHCEPAADVTVLWSSRSSLSSPLPNTSTVKVLRRPVESALTAPVRVQDGAGHRPAAGEHRRVHRLLDELSAHVVSHRPAQHPSRVLVADRVPRFH